MGYETSYYRFADINSSDVEYTIHFIHKQRFYHLRRKNNSENQDIFIKRLAEISIWGQKKPWEHDAAFVQQV